MSKPMYDQLAATAKAFIDSYNDAQNTRDPKKLSSALTPDCHRYFSPGSMFTLIPTLKAGFTNDQYEQNETEMIAKAESGPHSSKVVETTIDEKAKRVVMHTKHVAEIEGKTLEFEHMMTLRMNDDGTKVKEILQFVDSLAAFRFFEGTDEGRKIKEKRFS